MINTISCVITDDEPFARKGLMKYVEKTPFLELKAQCEDTIELGDYLDQHSVDLLFLDIQMPHVSGVDFLRSLVSPPKVIFTTAFKEYAIEGFELDVLDYILKPITYDRFMKSVFKAKDYFDLKAGNDKQEYIFLKSDGRLEKIVFSDVLYFEGMENYVIIHTSGRKIIVHSTLKALIEKFPAHQFIQTHKSFVVSLSRVTSIEGNMLSIEQHEVPVSRQLREHVIHKLVGNKKF